MASNSGGAAPQNKATPAVTRSSKQGCFSANNNIRPARTTVTLSLNQHGINGYGAPHRNVMRAEYAYATTNVQLQHSKGENISLASNSFKEVVALPEVARWKAASNKEMGSLRAHKLYDLVPITSIPPGQKTISSRWVYKIKADNSFKGRVVVPAWGKVSGRDFMEAFPSGLCDSEHPHSARYGGRRKGGWSGCSAFRQCFSRRTSRRTCGLRWPRDTRLRMKRRELHRQ